MFFRRNISFARTFVYFVFLIGCLPGTLAAADQWMKLTTPHFELYTSAGEKKGREAILYFEQVRSFFLQATPSKTAPDFPVRIVAFRGEKQYQPYRINDFAIAYYSQSRSHDYIVMQDISSEHYPVAIHEYTHLIIEHSGLHMPIWLNEGWADLYSTLKPMGKKAVVGDILPGRAQTLLGNKLIGLDVLSTVQHDSPLYNERNKASMFYAESWALVHMLYFSPDYRPNFSKFVIAVSSGKSMEDACQTALGKHMWEVETDLRKYLQGDRFYRAVVDVKLEKSDEEPEVAVVTPFESDLLLADVLALTGKRDDARRAYEQLAKNNPDKPEIEESLGYLAWRARDEPGARSHFGRALAAGTKNAQMCYQYAMLDRQGGTGEKDVLPALQRAVELKPDYTDARLELGLTLVNQQRYQQAIGNLRQIKKVSPEQATYFFSALAYSYLQTGDLVEARKNAETAKKWANTPGQTEQMDSLLRFMDARKTSGNFSPPDPKSQANPFITKDDKMSRVEGIAQSLDCNGDTVRFSVLVDKTPMLFEIPDPERIVIKHSGELKHDFACGPQKPFHVAVDYAALPDAKLGTAGIVRSLEF